MNSSIIQPNLVPPQTTLHAVCNGDDPSNNKARYQSSWNSTSAAGAPSDEDDEMDEEDPDDEMDDDDTDDLDEIDPRSPEEMPDQRPPSTDPRPPREMQFWPRN